MKKEKKLNLNKYSFLYYLKSDFYCWISNNENYIKISQSNEVIRNKTHWKYKELVLKEKASNLEKPAQMIDGIMVGEKAKDFYKEILGGDYLYFDLDSDYGFKSMEEKVKKTKSLLEENKNIVIFEAAFSWNDFNMKVDVLIKNNDKIKLVEVKGVTVPLYYHALDVMFQYYILKNIGYDVKRWSFKLLTLNKNFVYYKQNNDKLRGLFTEWGTYFNSKPADLDKALEKSSDIPILDIVNSEEWFDYFMSFEKHLNRIKEIQRSETFPNISLEERNFKGMDSEIEDQYLIYAGLPSRDSLFEYSGDSGFTKWDKATLFNEGNKYISDVHNEDLVSKSVYDDLSGNFKTLILENGNVDLENISDSIIENDIIKKSKKVKRLIQKFSLITNSKLVVEDKIRKHLTKYKKVIYHFDFETVQVPIPNIENIKVYEQVPYQYSIHVILDSSDFDFETMRNVVHIEWLAKDKENFYEEFWKNFTRDIFSYGKDATFVSYNKQFENMIIKNRIDKNVEVEEENNLKYIMDNTIDLMEIFADKWYYHNQFKGSYSIKYVGPHFAPEINYANLDERVRKGDQSAKQCKIWLIHNDKEHDNYWKEIRPHMLKYCEYDTLLMVVIFQRLRERYLK